jgi:hypothetical protein
LGDAKELVAGQRSGTRNFAFDDIFGHVRGPPGIIFRLLMPSTLHRISAKRKRRGHPSSRFGSCERHRPAAPGVGATGAPATGVPLTDVCSGCGSARGRDPHEQAPLRPADAHAGAPRQEEEPASALNHGQPSCPIVKQYNSGLHFSVQKTGHGNILSEATTGRSNISDGCIARLKKCPKSCGRPSCWRNPARRVEPLRELPIGQLLGSLPAKNQGRGIGSSSITG